MTSSLNLLKELRPVTSTTTRRYGKFLWVDAYHTTIAPGLRLRTSTTSSWLSLTHPEGQLYFHMKRDRFSAVTEENVLNVETDNLVSSYLALIEKRILECGIILPQACELFVELRFDESSQTSTCAYYFVDHHSRCLFWLEPTSSELLDMGMVVSDSHLDIALERLYWVHVEFFPMHVCAQMTPLILDNLISVICHGMTDRMTSRSSTFPYTEEKCDQLLRALSLRQGEPLDAHTLCFVARLWGAINNQRFITYYGQENAQLDRLQPPMPEDIADRTGIRALANLMLWGVPNHHYSKLHDLFVHDNVYIDHWQAFMTECISEWRGLLVWAFSVLIASILISMLPRASLSSAMAPILAASSSILSGSILLWRHHDFEDATASFAANFLRSSKSSDWGFLPLSVVYSMPKAMYLWSIGLMVAQLVFWTFRVVGVLWASGGAGFLALMGYGILYFTSLEDDHTGSMATMLRSHWQTFQSDSAAVTEPLTV
ncbi:uncharacterized protein F5891DRAFT_1024927 [Suillus fuscotomentosus]|uniref:Uncharacterized protein n=1 Tax=Suillus fuscotomentosus TaxID=1912939 RepID=A0AAD4HLK1_9AGAM|nr:uncharacterized protein F5891DRAFT_1024927 [Suillus fuscotomentosus]KAG1902145.1 hypothetical protein F5891DRAFT_1024927 [Suillus fuscotomentosus]